MPAAKSMRGTMRFNAKRCAAGGLLDARGDAMTLRGVVLRKRHNGVRNAVLRVAGTRYSASFQAVVVCANVVQPESVRNRLPCVAQQQGKVG